MSDHLKTLFSSQATKAWIAGLSVVLGAYLIPVISQWMASLTPEALAGYGLPYGLAAVVVGAIGVVWTYATKNRPK